MAPVVSPNGKSHIEKIWEVLTTLSPEAATAAQEKCQSLGLDTNKGIVSLEESFLNLRSNVLLLKDAIEKKKLIQLPLSIQLELSKVLSSISSYQTDLIAGTDQIENIASAVEQLHVATWKYGLHNLSDHVLGFQEKLNELKQLEKEAIDLRKELKKAIASKEDVDDLMARFEEQEKKMAEALKKATESSENAAARTKETVAAGQNASAILTAIQQAQTTANDVLAKTQASNVQVKTYETSIQKFFKDVETYRESMEQADEVAHTTVAENKEETKKLIEKLGALEDQIKDQIQRATGHSLFHSFQTRASLLSKSKWIWVIAEGVLVLSVVGVTLWIAHDAPKIHDIALWLKLSLTLPLAYAIAICHSRYSNERRLEEEYAFKANISISLVPYKELVEKFVDDKATYAKFLVDTINRVFETPVQDPQVEQVAKPDPELTEKTVSRYVAALNPIFTFVKGILQAKP